MYPSNWFSSIYLSVSYVQEPSDRSSSCLFVTVGTHKVNPGALAVWCHHTSLQCRGSRASTVHHTLREPHLLLQPSWEGWQWQTPWDSPSSFIILILCLSNLNHSVSTAQNWTWVAANDFCTWGTLSPRWPGHHASGTFTHMPNCHL